MAVLGPRFCARAFSSCGKWGPLFIAVRGPLTIAASLVVEHRLQTRRLSNCGSRAQSLRGMWDLPRPGLEPVSPALAGRLSTIAPPGKPNKIFWEREINHICITFSTVYCYNSSILLLVLVNLLLCLIYKLNFIIDTYDIPRYRKKNMLYIGFGIIRGFRHPLGVLDHIPWI